MSSYRQQREAESRRVRPFSSWTALDPNKGCIVRFYDPGKRLIDKVLILVREKVGQVRFNQIAEKFYRLVYNETSLQELIEQLKSKDGRRINNIICKVKPVICDTASGVISWFWVEFSIYKNPTTSTRKTLIAKKQYRPKLEGESYKDDTENFIQSCATKGDTRWVFLKMVHDVYEAFETLVNTANKFGLSVRKGTMWILEINTEINTSNPEADMERIKKIMEYIAGKAKRGGKVDDTYADYQLCKRMSIKFYRKIRPSSDASRLGLIRAEVVMRKVKFEDRDGIRDLIKECEDDLLALVSYVYEVLNGDRTASKPSTSKDLMIALEKHPELIGRAVGSKEAIPSHLKDYFTRIKCRNLSTKYVLKPSILNNFLIQES